MSPTPSLKPDQVRAILRHPVEGLGRQHRIVPVVGDHADADRAADGGQVPAQAFLLGLDQIGRQHQQAVGAIGLGGLGELDRHMRAVADAGEQRQVIGHFVRCRPHDALVFFKRQRKELAGAAGGEKPACSGSTLLRDMGAIAVFVEGAVIVEKGQRKGQQPAAKGFGQLGG